ncbi:MAG: type VI secretion system ATPase TssH [Massilia sp.]
MMLDVRALIGKLDPACRDALQSAADLCKLRRQAAVDPEHVIERLLTAGEPSLLAVLTHAGVAHDQLANEVRRCLTSGQLAPDGTPALSPRIVAAIEQGWLIASVERNDTQVGAAVLLQAMLRDHAQRTMLVASLPALGVIDGERLRDEFDSIVSPGAGQHGGGALARYTQDLTALARSRGIDPVTGREAEVRQIIDILMRRRQNNPLLTGEPGVGKTAVVEGFAARVASGDVPPALAGVAVLALDLGLLQAGASMKGEFESRLKAVIAEAGAAARPVIMFIDEAHQLIGAGGAEGQGDAANLLKPALARGELRTIAATTWGEYKQYVEKDPALARRFQVVKVDEPDEEAAVAMLRGVAANLERHHQVTILDAAVRDAVRLSQRYISERKLPDKAINVLDTACARVALGRSGNPVELETLRRDIAGADIELRVLGREAVAGTDYASRIAELTARLQEWRAREADLVPRLRLERAAVDAVLAQRAALHAAAEGSGHDEDDDAGSVAQLSIELERLEAGLAVIQNEQPLVPLCVDARAVAAVVAGWTGVPIGKMLADELHTVLHLRQRLAERVIGQDLALEAIAHRMHTFHAGLDDPCKPAGVFLLVGPSGVGKTETAAALADLLYGGERNMVVVNMSEFQEAHTVSMLKGAPPGYVGFGRGGVLTEAVRRKPFCVVLLDEVEKAHADVMELFYNVFDKGSMEDGQGQSVDFRNTVILLTSNVGDAEITAACDGAQPDNDSLATLLRPALLAHFRPAFLGRLAVVPYRPLGREQISAIVRLKLDAIRRRFERQHQATLQVDAALAGLVAQRCTQTDSGARAIDHILAQTLLPQLAARVLERLALVQPFSQVRIGADASGAFTYRFEDRAVA